MRVQKTNADLKVLAIAGTYVVGLGFNLSKSKCTGLLGFSIQRKDHETNDTRFIQGMKCFAETDPGFPPGASYSSEEHPIQSFQWADYTAYPGKTYTYVITALKGTPTNLQILAKTSVKVKTESPTSGDQDVYFNRGVAASQEYVRRFGDKEPDDPSLGRTAFNWLSRGLFKAMEDFINSCEPGKHELRIAAYEFNSEDLLGLIKKVSKNGVKIKIVYDAQKAIPGDGNRAAIKKFKLTAISKPRTAGSYISHNKFIVKLENGKAVAVLTGGTNFSRGGIYGHSNVAHVVENEKVANKFLQYWELLHDDLEVPAMKEAVEELSPLSEGQTVEGISIIFSPRKSLKALHYYADIAKEAQGGLFMTFAFGMNETFKDVYRESAAPLRIALLEKATRPMKKNSPEHIAELKAIQKLRNMPENVFAIGDFVRTNELDGWVKESLSGLNKNVRYIHNKFMLVDPLADDPIVVAGSANFSNASTLNNDENMLIIRGNTRVADIYLGEFMRLWKHHAFRESLQWRQGSQSPKPLRTDDWWRESFGDTENSSRRKYFAQVNE